MKVKNVEGGEEGHIRKRSMDEQLKNWTIDGGGGRLIFTKKPPT